MLFNHLKYSNLKHFYLNYSPKSNILCNYIPLQFSNTFNRKNYYNVISKNYFGNKYKKITYFNIVVGNIYEEFINVFFSEALHQK